MESPKISPQSQDNADVLEDSGCNLVLHNDDVHTFDYVIKSLVDICRISYAQAEQCTILVHCHGKFLSRKHQARADQQADDQDHQGRDQNNIHPSAPPLTAAGR